MLLWNSGALLALPWADPHNSSCSWVDSNRNDCKLGEIRSPLLHSATSSSDFSKTRWNSQEFITIIHLLNISEPRIAINETKPFSYFLSCQFHTRYFLCQSVLSWTALTTFPLIIYTALSERQICSLRPHWSPTRLWHLLPSMLNTTRQKSLLDKRNLKRYTVKCRAIGNTLEIPVSSHRIPQKHFLPPFQISQQGQTDQPMCSHCLQTGFFNALQQFCPISSLRMAHSATCYIPPLISLRFAWNP